MTQNVVAEPENRPESQGGEPGRLLAQRTFFAARSFPAPDAMYAAATLGAAVTERERVTVEPHAQVTTNTYFGRFPASYWQRYTEVASCDLEAVVTGSGKLAITASDSHGDPRTVAHKVVEGAEREPIRLTAPIDRFVDGGALWLDIETGGERLIVENVRWTVAAAKTPRPISVVICTHNRADYCIETLVELAEDPVVRDYVTAVHVTDQGTDTVDSRERFAQVKELLGDKLRYVRQPNLGGAGGFTRGMYETLEGPGGEDAHILLMDDDIKLESDTIMRISALANSTTEPAVIGGQNLCELHPDRLFVDADVADLPKLRAGIDRSESLSQRSMLDHSQERRVDATHNAWWCCLLPAEVVRAVGYPLPIFFQWDDVEYGLRARGAGFFTVTLPGAGVWHQDLYWKGWDDWARYFHYRNGLITGALHNQLRPKEMAQFLLTEFMQTLASMQYGLAATMIKAIEDFLDGPGTLDDGGANVVPSIRMLRAEYPETHIVPAANSGVRADHAPIVRSGWEPSKPTLVLLKRLAMQYLDKPGGGAAIRSGDEAWWHVSLFRTAVVTDASQTGVRVRRLDKKLMTKLGKQGLAVLWRLRQEGAETVRRYHQEQPRLTGKENWERLFGAR
ncbi:glycosyltransferase [Amycolatopsis alkalitolerans]|uniref:Glycosyltransferase family 2 protein n=1 Tax=Amycolatopsis alkalitolerans TaxID=2547244 RepID=A0A5C4M369_9PSEU|nr:glycosyltransferase [Amycolatopsis alkalitolerans]TNC27448.1 glycosyltransferase family 2 protein [Amycolatopsis alkalitolerans]